MKKKVFRELYSKKLEEVTEDRRALEKLDEEATDLFFKSIEEDLEEVKPKKRGRKKNAKSNK